jgi:hypothetical protein
VVGSELLDTLVGHIHDIGVAFAVESDLTAELWVEVDRTFVEAEFAIILTHAAPAFQELPIR